MQSVFHALIDIHHFVIYHGESIVIGQSELSNREQFEQVQIDSG